MKVSVIGHSYVKYLENLGPDSWKVRLENVQGLLEKAEFKFKSFPGKDYQYVLEHFSELEFLKEENPDIVVVILGGNSIIDTNTNADIKVWIREFYGRLRTLVRPNCRIISAQIEPRFPAPGNRFGAPDPEKFKRRRAILNDWVNKSLRKHGIIDNIILIAGREYFDHPSHFVDGVHLKQRSLLELQRLILGTIEYGNGVRK